MWSARKKYCALQQQVTLQSQMCYTKREILKMKYEQIGKDVNMKGSIKRTLLIYGGMEIVFLGNEF